MRNPDLVRIMTVGSAGDCNIPRNCTRVGALRSLAIIALFKKSGSSSESLQGFLEDGPQKHC